MAESTTTERATRVLEHAAEASAAGAEAHRRAVDELTDLSVGVAKEGARLSAELGQTALEAYRDGLAAAGRWQALWPDLVTDPVRWYQHALVESMDSGHRALTLFGTNARLMVEAADRLQAAAELTGRRMREALSTGTQRTRESARRAA